MKTRFYMISLKKIFESVTKIREDMSDVYYDFNDRINSFASRVLSMFLYDNNENYSANLPWRLIAYPRLKKIWETWAEYGFVRDEDGLSTICDIMISNTIKINTITMLLGHTSESPDDYYDDAWGDHIRGVIDTFYYNNGEDDTHTSNDPNQLEFGWDKPDGKIKDSSQFNKKLIRDPYLEGILEEIDPKTTNPDKLYNFLKEKLEERFMWDYVEDKDSGHARISDFALEGKGRLNELCLELMSTTDSYDKVIIVDKMLNVVHQRSDLASWFVRGGSNALSDLSASPSERESNE